MKKSFSVNFKPSFAVILVVFLFAAEISYSQNWVRKVDGFSMWSIGKDYAGNIYAGTTGTARGIFKSTDDGETWTNVFSTGTSNYLYLSCDSLNNVYVANVSNGVIYSTDGGQSFNTIPVSTFGGANVNSVACGRNGHIFVGVTSGGIWRSTDYGATFTNSGLQTYSIVEIRVDRFNPDIIYAGSSSTGLNGFFISTDGGVTFNATTNAVNVWEILQTSTGDLYTATTTSPYPFNKSTDGGATWTTMGNQPGAMRGGTLDLNEDIYISGNGGVFKSTNGGATFINHNITFSTNEILTFGNKIMVCATGAANGGVWIYTDTSIVPVELTSFTAASNNGNVELSWSTSTELNNRGFEIQRKALSIAEGLAETWKNIDFVPGYGTTTDVHNYSFIDESLASGKYLYRLKQIDFDGNYKYSDIVEVMVSAPAEFSLEQNYPNPFNPTTTIIFVIPNVGTGLAQYYVTLKVYDVLGNEVATLVNEEKEPGTYDVQFTMSNLPAGRHDLSSGIYFYKLQAGSFTQTRKMLLIK